MKLSECTFSKAVKLPNHHVTSYVGINVGSNSLSRAEAIEDDGGYIRVTQGGVTMLYGRQFVERCAELKDEPLDRGLLSTILAEGEAKVAAPSPPSPLVPPSPPSGTSRAWQRRKNKAKS
jgi:hypothetical protein